MSTYQFCEPARGAGRNLVVWSISATLDSGDDDYHCILQVIEQVTQRLRIYDVALRGIVHTLFCPIAATA